MPPKRDFGFWLFVALVAAAAVSGLAGAIAGLMVIQEANHLV